MNFLFGIYNTGYQSNLLYDPNYVSYIISGDEMMEDSNCQAIFSGFIEKFTIFDIKFWYRSSPFLSE